MATTALHPSSVNTGLSAVTGNSSKKVFIIRVVVMLLLSVHTVFTHALFAPLQALSVSNTKRL